LKWIRLIQMYNSKLHNKFCKKYCKKGKLERNEKFFSKNTKILKIKWIFFFNFFFENFILFFIKFYFKRKKIARYAEIIPKILTKHQRIIKTLSFLSKHWKLFSLERYNLLKQKEILYKLIYKNNLNYTRWR